MGIFASVSADAQGRPAPFGRCSRRELADRIRTNYDVLCSASTKLPIAYADAYNIGFLGLERFHPFDSTKFGKVVNNLVSSRILSRAQVYRLLGTSHAETLLCIYSGHLHQEIKHW
jgi:hypothetical protein